MRRFPWIELLSVLVIGQAGFADTTWVAGGYVDGNWNAEHSPYMISGMATVQAGHTLTIGPGVNVVFSGSWSLTAFGTLNVQGTITDTVFFRPAHEAIQYTGVVLAGTVAYELNYCCIEDVRAGGQSVALSLQGTSETLNHCVVRRSAHTGILAGGGTTVTMNHCLVTQCGWPASSWGPGLDLQSGVAATLTNCEISDNSSSVGAGVHAQTGSALTCTDCSFLRNRAGTDGGGGFLSRCQAVFHRCSFKANYAALWGGALLVGLNSRAEFDECVFETDTAMNGAAMWVDGDSTQVSFTRCAFIQNVGGHEGYSGYAILYVNGGTAATQVTADRCTFYGNRTLFSSSPVVITGRGFRGLSNSIIAGTRGGAALGYTLSSYSIDYCCFFDNTGGDIVGGAPERFGIIDEENVNGDSCDGYQNLFLDPLFADTAGDDFHLTVSSPCVDAGDPASPHDPDSTVADIGAFYYAHALRGTSANELRPSSFTLSVYPNPFNPQTEIRFDLPQAGRVSLKICDLLGREVAVLVSKPLTAGAHNVLWNGADQPSGMYFAVLKAGNEQRTQRLVLLK